MATQVETVSSAHREDDQILDYDGAVAFFGGRPKKATLQDWVATGRYGIPFIKVGHFVRFRRSSLAAWLKSRERNGNQQ